MGRIIPYILIIINLNIRENKSHVWNHQPETVHKLWINYGDLLEKGRNSELDSYSKLNLLHRWDRSVPGTSVPVMGTSWDDRDRGLGGGTEAAPGWHAWSFRCPQGPEGAWNLLKLLPLPGSHGISWDLIGSLGPNGHGEIHGKMHGKMMERWWDLERILETSPKDSDISQLSHASWLGSWYTWGCAQLLTTCYLYIIHLQCSSYHILSFLAKAPILLISDSKLGSRTIAGLGERPSAAFPSLCSLPTDLAESRLSLLCICNLKASDGPLRGVPPVTGVQRNIGNVATKDGQTENVRGELGCVFFCPGFAKDLPYQLACIGMCIQMLKRSTKETQSFH